MAYENELYHYKYTKREKTANGRYRYYYGPPQGVKRSAQAAKESVKPWTPTPIGGPYDVPVRRINIKKVVRRKRNFVPIKRGEKWVNNFLAKIK